MNSKSVEKRGRASAVYPDVDAERRAVLSSPAFVAFYLEIALIIQAAPYLLSNINVMPAWARMVTESCNIVITASIARKRGDQRYCPSRVFPSFSQSADF